MGGLDQMGGDQRTRQGGEQRVLVLIHGVGGDGARDVLIHELLAHVDNLAGDNAQGQGLFLDLLKAVMLLANVAQNGDDVEVHFLLQPLDADRGVQTAGIREYNFLLAHGNRPFDFAGPPPAVLRTRLALTLLIEDAALWDEPTGAL